MLTGMTLMVPEITSMRAQRMNLRIVRDETFRFGLTVREVDPDAEQPTDPSLPRVMRPLALTGYTVTLVVKASSTTPGSLLSLSRESPQITVTDNLGRIVVDLSDEFTATLTWDYGVYKLRIEQPGEADGITLLKGEVTVE
jgi:hypothetical protein